MSIFVGSGTALVTPFDEHGVDFEAFESIIDFQIENNTDALVVCGTTGEPSTMTYEEKFEVIQFAIEKADGRVPIIAGTGGNNTAKVISDSQKAEKLGADALLIVTPYYNKTTQKGLVAHYHAVADAVNIPIVVYNVPGRTGLNVLPETLKEIAKHPNIAAMKEASGNIKQISDMVRLCGDSIDMYSGEDGLTLPLLACGGIGVISVVSNITPKEMHDLVMTYHEGDVAGARAIQHRLDPLIDTLFIETNPIPVKTGLNLMGYNAGILRLPLIDMSESSKARLIKEMKTIGLI